jgi:hypothetical protein
VPQATSFLPGQWRAKRLHINFVTRPAKKAATPGVDEGYLKAELLDADGMPVTGFTRDDCPLLREKHAGLPVKWKGGGTAPAEARQAKFYFKRAFPYGFEFRDGNG